MKRVIAAIAIVLVLSSIVAGTIVYPRMKYATQATIYFSIYDSNSPWRFYLTAPAAADVYVTKDGGTPAQSTNAAAKVGAGRVMKLILTATEMTAADVVVDINDASTTKLFGDETIIIPTFGNASAHFVWDDSTATPTVDTYTVRSQNVLDPNNHLVVALHSVSASAGLATTNGDGTIEPNIPGIWAYASRTLTDKTGFRLSSTGIADVNTAATTWSLSTTVDGNDIWNQTPTGWTKTPKVMLEGIEQKR